MSNKVTIEEIADKVTEVLNDVLRIKTPALGYPLVKTMEDLGADSLDVIEIGIELEDHFGIEISEEDVTKLDNVGTLIKYLKLKIGGSP